MLRTGHDQGGIGTYGGFAGQVGGRAYDYTGATATVNIVCNGIAGGFVGKTATYSTHKYTFTDCEASGNVSGEIVGGFAGATTLGGDGKSVYVTFDNCVASGAVSGTVYASSFNKVVAKVYYNGYYVGAFDPFFVNVQ